jgi:RecB family exonuclease
VGRIDRVEVTDRGLRLIDYKTATRPPPRNEVAGSLQMGIYALAAAADPELAPHGPVVEAEMWFPLARRLRHPFPLAQLDSVRHRLVSVAAAVADEQWEPNPGPQCQRCHFRLVCPAWPEGRLEVE